MGSCNAVREGQFGRFAGCASLPSLPVVGMLFLGDVSRSGAVGWVDAIVSDVFQEIDGVGVDVMVLGWLPCSLQHFPKSRTIKHEAHDAEENPFEERCPGASSEPFLVFLHCCVFHG